MNKNSLSLLLLLAIGQTAQAGFTSFAKEYLRCCCCPQTDEEELEIQMQLVPNRSKRKEIRIIRAESSEPVNAWGQNLANLFEAQMIGAQSNLLAIKKATGGA